MQALCVKMKKLLTKIKLWYKGYADFQSHINDSEHPRLIITAYPPSPLRKIIVAVVNFWIKHWKWIITTIITFGLLVFAAMTFFFIVIK